MARRVGSSPGCVVAGRRLDYPSPTTPAVTRVMKANRKTGSKPEVLLRRALHAEGREHVAGKDDLRKQDERHKHDGLRGCADERGDGRADGHADKRGGGIDALTLTTRIDAGERAVVEVLALDELLAALHTLDERAAQIVELRYFGGYSEVEIAEMLGISDRTLRRDWRKARAFLLAEMSP